MQKKAFIFIGRSGCGKGTQADLLIEGLKEQNPEIDILHLESGDRFRKLVEGDSFTSTIAKKINDDGGLQPAFLSAYVWTDLLVDNLKENQTVVFDGTPRRKIEAEMLEVALDYYGFEKGIVVFLNVSEDWARERLAGRGRNDDKDASDVVAKMAWFKTEVMPSINYMKESPKFDVFDINGEQTIEEVHNDIKEKVF